MERREHTEWTDAFDDPGSEPDGIDADGSGGEETVAQRLNRVTRYASGAATPQAPEPDADPRPEYEPAPDLEGPSAHETAPAAAELQEIAPADAAPYQPAPAEAPPAMPQAPRHPPAPGGPAPETAPAGQAAPEAPPLEQPQPDLPAAEPPVEASPAPIAPESVPALEPEPAPVESSPAPPVEDIPAEVPAVCAPRPDPAAAEVPTGSPEQGADNGERLTVGRGIRLVAKLCECAELVVEGHLEATARTRHLTVAKGGHFIGSAEADSAEVHGHFEGNLTVTKRLVISATGSVAGTTRYQEIVIEAGGQVMGNAQRLAENAEA